LICAAPVSKQARHGSVARRMQWRSWLCLLTLEMLAERADLHPNYVGAVERGERNLSLYNIWRLAHGLGLTAADLMQALPTRK